MARGRPPEPDSVNNLKGDPGKRRRYEVAPEAPKGRPVAPAYLGPVAREEWDRVVPMLEDMGVLSKVDGSALICYVEAWERYRQAQEIIAKNGPLTLGVQGKYSPLNKVIAENLAIIKHFLTEFGGTAAARVRMRYKPETKKTASKWGGIVGA